MNLEQWQILANQAFDDEFYQAMTENEKSAGSGCPDATCSASSKGHFGDKVLHCKWCDQDIFIPHNQVGGFWHLGGWTNPHGLKFWGGYCSPCFRKLDDIISLPNIKDSPFAESDSLTCSENSPGRVANG